MMRNRQSANACPTHLRCVVVATARRETLLRGIAATLSARGWANVAVYMDVLEVPGETADLVVLGPKDSASLEWARQRQASGCLIIPDPLLTARVVDRVACRSLLRAANLCVPAAVTASAADLLVAMRGPNRPKPPFVIKFRREHGTGIVEIKNINAAERYLKAIDADAELVLEEKIEGVHLTAYILGAMVALFGRPAFGPAETETGRLNKVPDDIVNAILSFRELTGILFGKLDVVRANNGSLLWVDVGVFPRFQNIPEATTIIGDLIYNRAQQTNMAALKG